MQLFHRPFDDQRLSPVEDATLKLSLLKAIPPPTPAQTAFALHLPEEVQELSVSKIIDHVIDLASGYVRLPMYIGPPREVVAHSILPILAEKAGVDLCKLCLSPQRGCTCAPHPPPGLWSQTSAAPQASVMTVTASMTPVTTLSTSYGGPGVAGPTSAAFPPLPEPTRQAPVPSLMHQPRSIASSAFQVPQTTSSLGGAPATAPPPVQQSKVQTSVGAPASAYRLPSPMQASLMDQGIGRGGVIRSHSTSLSESFRPILGRGQQQEHPWEEPQDRQVGCAPGQAHPQSHPVVFNCNVPSGQAFMQAAVASLQGGDVEPVSTGLRSGYTDLMESHRGGGPCTGILLACPLPRAPMERPPRPGSPLHRG